MKAKNIFWASALILVGVYLATTEVKTNITQDLSPDKLHNAVIEKTRYVEVEEVAHLIISKDPSLQLIDVRDEKYYNKFSLKTAFNIPLRDFLKEDNLAYLDQDVYKTILYSNGTTDADVAWVLATRLGYKNVYVMKGGLNTWVESILEPRDHSVIWDRVDDEMYQYRKGASQFFGGKDASSTEVDQPVKPKKKVIKREKKEVEGGCG
jgi:rhodanese-related sulfurtransferase